MTTEVFVLPASSAQQRLWFLDRLLHSGAAYNVCQAFRLLGPLDCTVLSAALDLVVARHESLRTSFRHVDGELRQIIHPGLTVPLVQVDHSALGAEEFDAALNADGARPFDLTAPPLLRATVFHVGPGAAVLLIVAHHIVVDGWSMALLLRELADGYHALADGRPPLLPPLPVQYADFTLWEQKLLQGPDHPDVVFWRTKLQDVVAPLDLPSDRLRTTGRSFRGHLLTFRIEPALTDRLRALSLDGGGSIFIAALTAYAAVLHRSTGATTILIGAPVANRPLPELEQVVGFFANTVVFRADLRDDPSLRSLMKRIRRDALDVYSHQGTPFDQIVRALGPRHTSERNPLFQVALAHQQQPDVLFSLPEIETVPLVVANGTAKFEMLVELQERSADVDCLLEMSDDLFTPAAAARFRDHFLDVLKLLVDEPERRLSELPLMSAGDQAVVDLTNATDVDYPHDRTIAELFDEQARATPGRIAVVDGDDELTYEQLNDRADALARRLIARGVGPEVAVGVALGRSINLIVALLGILKAGGAYVPVDAAYPADRVAYMLTDCGAPLIVTAKAFAGQLPGDVPTIGLDDGTDVSSGETGHHLAPAGRGDRLAYVMYTSGSTGRPKGVAIPNRGVVRLVRGSNYVDWDDVEAMLYVSSVAFDVSMFEIWGALLNGKRLVVVPEHDFSLEQLARLLDRSKVDCVWLTAALFNALVDYRTEALAGVRQLVVGGEALSVPHVRRAFDRLPSTRIINGYGPTECSTFACCHSIPRTLPHDAVSVPIGVPIANTRAHVLDDRLAELPVGAAGELCLGGDGLARGYLNDPATTAERFVPVALGGRPGARLYRTGDRVRRLADGTLDFLGRLDGQVKLRGFRIELGGDRGRDGPAARRRRRSRGHQARRSWRRAARGVREVAIGRPRAGRRTARPSAPHASRLYGARGRCRRGRVAAERQREDQSGRPAGSRSGHADCPGGRTGDGHRTGHRPNLGRGAGRRPGRSACLVLRGRRPLAGRTASVRRHRTRRRPVAAAEHPAAVADHRQSRTDRRCHPRECEHGPGVTRSDHQGWADGAARVRPLPQRRRRRLS